MLMKTNQSQLKLGLGKGANKQHIKMLPFSKKGGLGVNPKVYISDILLFEKEIFKGSVNSENRLQTCFLSYKG